MRTPRDHDAGPELVLLVDDDVTVREAMAAALDRRGRKIMTCSDLEWAQLLIERFSFHAAILDVRLTGPFGFEGLELIRFIIQKQPATRAVLITGDASPELRREATARGAVALLQKPFCIDDIEVAIGSGFDERGVGVSQTIDVPGLDTILTERRLCSAFQPIVTSEGEVFGYESLARLDAPPNDLAMFFRYAERKHRLLEVELACIESAFRSVAHLPEGTHIFVNVHPHVLTLGRRFTDSVFTTAGRAGVSLRRVIFEITEQAALGSDSNTSAALLALRESGAVFAFDDVGVAYSHYTDLPRVRPSFLKVSQAFGTDFEADPYRTKIVRNIASLGEAFGIDVILEGVESSATARAAREMGIRYLQGFWFGRPAAATQIAQNSWIGVN